MERPLFQPDRLHTEGQNVSRIKLDTLNFEGGISE